MEKLCQICITASEEKEIAISFQSTENQTGKHNCYRYCFCYFYKYLHWNFFVIENFEKFGQETDQNDEYLVLLVY